METPSSQFKLNIRDVARGFLMAFIGAALAGSLDLLQDGDITKAGVRQTVIAGLIAGISYILKNFFTDGNKVKRKVVIEAVEKGYVNPLKAEFIPEDAAVPGWTSEDTYPCGYRVQYDGITWEAQRPLQMRSRNPSLEHPEDWKPL